MEKNSNTFFGGMSPMNKKIIMIVCVVVVTWVGSLFALIPISDRIDNSSDAASSIEKAWGGDRQVNGVDIKVTKTAGGEAYVIPATYNVTSTTKEKMLHKGIYNSPVYVGKVEISGDFDLSKLSSIADVNYSSAIVELRCRLSLEDVASAMNIGGESIPMTVGDSGHMTAVLDLTPYADQKSVPFSVELELRGSNSFSIACAGINNHIKISGDQPSPSFTDGLCPDERTVTSSGYTSYLDLNYANMGKVSTISNDYKSLQHDNVIVKFFYTDTYDTVYRSVKYSILIIVLTFIGALLVDLWKKSDIKAFQYLLVGLSLVLFYGLLLSISEFCGFGIGYLIASVMTVGLNAMFFGAATKSVKGGYAMGGILSIIYVFIYVLMNIGDKAMLLGSLTLFVLLAALMFVSIKCPGKSSSHQVPQSQETQEIEESSKLEVIDEEEN